MVNPPFFNVFINSSKEHADQKPPPDVGFLHPRSEAAGPLYQGLSVLTTRAPAALSIFCFAIIVLYDVVQFMLDDFIRNVNLFWIENCRLFAIPPF